MQDAIRQSTVASDRADGLAAAAAQAEAWGGEPFLRPDEDPGQALAPGQARRNALDEALAEMEADAERRRPPGR
jgi:hypothetical protein